MISDFQSFPAIDLNENELNYAIQVENVTFGYNRKIDVLKNFTVRIAQGGIFALLGSNGCGKTTLLKLILGQTKPRFGKVRVYGLKPGDKCSDIPGRGVGYMPQDIALFEKFTIRECLHYFGKIYDMNITLVDHRISLLTELLYLPKWHKKICEMSGGQKRLVSMAVTIIHRPKLLILDEPTVGVDSILRCRIWSYLESIAKNYGTACEWCEFAKRINTCFKGTTIIITTHYIEEAKNANMVGFISKGLLLKQADPQQLLKQHNCSTLEEAFFILCQDHYRTFKEGKVVNSIAAIEDESDIDIPINTTSKNGTKFIALNRINALAKKNLVRLKRSTMTLGMYFILPLVTISIFRQTVGTVPRNVPIAIYFGNDTGNKLLADRLTEAFDDDLVKFKYYDDKQAAIDSVRAGKNMYALTFPQNFSQSVYQRLPDPFGVSDEVLKNSIIRIYADHSDTISSIFVRYHFFLRSILNFIHKLAVEMNLNPMIFTPPIDRTNPIFPGSFYKSETYPAAGILLAMIFLMSIAISSMVIIFEVTNKSLDRVYVSGVNRVEVLIVHMMEMSVLIAIQVGTCLALFYYLFDIALDSRVTHVFGLVFLHGIEGAGIGLLAALLFKSEIHVFIIIVGIMLPLLTCSGVIWPSEAIPPYARILTDWSPITQPLESLRSIIFRGLSIDHMRVWIGFVICLVYNALIYMCNILLVTFWKDFDINSVFPMLRVPNI